MLNFQGQVKQWLVTCFGPEVLNDKPLRSWRFIEEALELVQACGCPKDEVLKTVDYVYGRPVGEIG